MEALFSVRTASKRPILRKTGPFFHVWSPAMGDAVRDAPGARGSDERGG